jgi:hypothetical protein
MFLHANLSPKWNLRVPGAIEDLARRWEVLQPGNRPFREALAPPSDGDAASSSSSSSDSVVDLEGEVFDYLSTLSCDRSLERYAAAMAARANALRELEEARERREDEELERLLEAEQEEEESLGKRRRKTKRKKNGKSGKVEDREMPLWRAQAEQRRAARLEEEKRREGELLRRKRQRGAAALAADARAKSSSKRRGDDEQEQEEEEDEREEEIRDLDPDGDDLRFLLESEEPRPPVVAADLLPRGLPPNSFHPLNPGVDFAAAFRWGLRGTFEEFTPLTSFDWFLHFVNGGVRPAGRWLRRAAAVVARGGGGYFRPF